MSVQIDPFFSVPPIAGPIDQCGCLSLLITPLTAGDKKAPDREDSPQRVCYEQCCCNINSCPGLPDRRARATLVITPTLTHSFICKRHQRHRGDLPSPSPGFGVTPISPSVLFGFRLLFLSEDGCRAACPCLLPFSHIFRFYKGEVTDRSTRFTVNCPLL